MEATVRSYPKQFDLQFFDQHNYGECWNGVRKDVEAERCRRTCRRCLLRRGGRECSARVRDVSADLWARKTRKRCQRGVDGGSCGGGEAEERRQPPLQGCGGGG